MAIRVELSETGGVAGMRRLIALDGNRLSVVDRGRIRLERDVPDEALRTIGDQVRALENARPRRAYGREHDSSDVLTVRVEITDESSVSEVVEVVHDPGDPAPQQFWEVVQGLRRLGRPA